MKSERTGLVFTTLQGKPIYTQYLRRMIAEKAKKAGIQKDVHFHLLRHTYLTKLYARTKDIRLVQQVAGHADISTTQIYTQISGEDIREAMLDDREPEKIGQNIAEVIRTGLVPADPEDEKKVSEALDKALKHLSE